MRDVMLLLLLFSIGVCQSLNETTTTNTSSTVLTSSSSTAQPTTTSAAPATERPIEIRTCDQRPETFDRRTAIPLCRDLSQDFLACSCPPSITALRASGLPSDTGYGSATSTRRIDTQSDSDGDEDFDDDDVTGFVSYCTPLDGIICYAPTVPFPLRGGGLADECQLYGGYHFASAILFSVFLGFCGVDRFYTGHIAVGVVKLVTLGGIGIWWLIDTILLLVGVYRPANNFEWEPFW
eukprot:TRINITY_DN4756_c0_g1_i1.p1 TRINITY_DN4756_c0_g1~~TRINITY_DN4756_c0_g1_i1.p1  ORF type:complete len:251 (-),score=12.91 TRINITY_DN4756_c0_g1_i1:108-818(-)